MQIPSLQKISDSIPAASVRVREYFDLATTSDKSVTYYRSVYAIMAIGASTINSIGYMLIIPGHIANAFIYRDSKDLTLHCRHAATQVFQSLYFTAAMTTYLFLSIFPYSSYALRREIPYELRPEFKAITLKSTGAIHFDQQENNVAGASFKLYANTNSLNIDTMTDINHLLGILHSRSDLVLVLTSDEKSAYLVKRDTVKEQIMASSLLFHEIHPVTVEIETPKPPNISQETHVVEPAQPVTSSKEEENPPQPVAIEQGVIRESDFNVVNIPPPPIPIGRLESAWSTVVGHNHIYKEMKYRHILAHLNKMVTIGNGLALYNSVDKTKETSPLKSKCLELYATIIKPQNFADIRYQHQAFIYALREARDLLKPTDAEAFKNWIHFLAIQRFTGVHLYGYCKELVAAQTFPFQAPLTLDNFATQLEERNKKIPLISKNEGLIGYIRDLQRFAGYSNNKDFLLKYNIPYVYGQIKKGDKTVTILRHGTPITHYSFLGRLNVTSDYEAFIEGAGANILHVILENGIVKYKGGNESGRVKARLALGEKHPNFYPLALRLDGHFVQPATYISKTIEGIKKEFTEEMFGEGTGFVIPQKTNLSQEQFRQFMESVQSTFFDGQTHLETLQEFQAFIVLTYAELILSLCDTLNVSYLEALCKDDMDRGGAMKAVIVLLHLYKTGKFAAGAEQKLSEALEELMVNMIAAPLIVRKNAILESRSAFVNNVIQVMQKTVSKTPVPASHYVGNFNVLSEPHQGVMPLGSTCRTAVEYTQFLDQVRRGSIVLKTNLSENIIQQCAQNYIQTKNTAPIIHQIERDLKGLKMTLNGVELNPGRTDPGGVPARLLAALHAQGIEGDTAWHILSAFTQTIGSDLTTSLQPLFNNEMLEYILMPDNKSMATDSLAGLSLTAENGKASIKLVMLNVVASSSDPEKVITRVRTTLEIPDHRASGAIVTTMVG